MKPIKLILLAVLVTSLSGCDAFVASPLADYFLTSDQQGRYAFEQHDYQMAADKFTDPMWKGIASYYAGRYEVAAIDFSHNRTAESLFNMGNALIRSREYSQATLAFEEVLKIEAHHPGASRNLTVTQAIIAYLGEARQEGGTEVGADEFRFDNTSNKGLNTVIQQKDQLKMESADQWMRTVDTRPGDFLRTKFAIEVTR